MKELVKKVLKSSGLGKAIYPVAQRLYRLYSIPHRRHLLQKNGLVLLKEIDKILQENRIDYFVEFGTLLGVIREKDFIKSDDDLDIMIAEPGMDPKRVIKIFLDAGYQFIHALTYHGKIRIFALSHMGLSIDFYVRDYSDDRTCLWRYGIYYDPNKAYPDVKSNSCLRRSYDLKYVPVRHEFKGIEISIPANAEEYLECQFGSDWRVPNPTCKTAPKEVYTFLDDYALREMDLKEVMSKY